jgi:LPS export ABC transporter protein LptC/lipopolysaccharide transport protein LptA
MEQTVKTLRIALPILFISFLIVIGLSFNRSKTKRDKSGTEPVTSTIRPPTERAQIESRGFEDTQTIAGRIVSRIRAERAVAFSSGWNTLENVQLTIYRMNGLTYDLTCPQAQFNSKTKEADAKGGVKLTSSDGIEIQSAEMQFDGNKLTNHIPVQFKVDAWAGHAGGLDLDVEEETLRLFEKVDAVMTSKTPGELPLHLAGDEGVFRRKNNNLTFTRNVSLKREGQDVHADTMIAKFTPDRKAIIGVEGSGSVVMRMLAGSTQGTPSKDGLNGSKTITCDRFFSDLGAEGKIVALNAVGEKAPAHAVVAGPPERDLVARSFRVGLDGSEVTDIKADSQVVMKEGPPLPRELSADHMTVGFDRATRRASSAVIEGNFKYKDPKNSASAARANYDIPNDRVILTAEPGSDPEVVSDGQTLKANVIELAPRAGTITARGTVIVQLISRPDGGASLDTTQMFPSGKPVYVNSDLVNIVQATKTAVFTGNVRAWQDNNTLFAQELQVAGNGDQLTARGNVRTVLYNSGAETRKTPVLSRSDSMVAHKNERRIDLLSNVKIDDDTRTLTSERASFFFDANKKLERTEAENKVTLTDRAAGRQGSGNKATYQMQKRLITLYGTPAKVSDPKGSFTGEQLLFDLAKNKVDVVSPNAQTEGSYKP